MSNKPNSREAILDTASRLFFTQGYHATGLNQIIKDSDSPKGSLYYHFPKGKEELALTCINRTSEVVSQRLRYFLETNNTTVEGVREFILGMAKNVVETSYKGMVPFSFWLAVETSCISEELRNTCQAVFKDWQDTIMLSLIQEGIEERTASDRASVVISLYEGALLQALTQRDEQPLLAAADIIPMVLSK